MALSERHTPSSLRRRPRARARPARAQRMRSRLKVGQRIGQETTHVLPILLLHVPHADSWRAHSHLGHQCLEPTPVERLRKAALIGRLVPYKPFDLLLRGAREVMPLSRSADRFSPCQRSSDPPSLVDCGAQRPPRIATPTTGAPSGGSRSSKRPPRGRRALKPRAAASFCLSAPCQSVCLGSTKCVHLWSRRSTREGKGGGAMPACPVGGAPTTPPHAPTTTPRASGSAASGCSPSC